MIYRPFFPGFTEFSCATRPFGFGLPVFWASCACFCQKNKMAANLSLMSLEDWLKDSKLHCYLENFLKFGYDDLSEILQMSDELLSQLTVDVDMVSKPNHVRRFRSSVATTKGKSICPQEKTDKKAESMRSIITFYINSIINLM